MSALQAYLKSKEKNIATLACSAIAAQILDDGCTAHSALQSPTRADQDSTHDVSADSLLADAILEN